MKPKDKAIELVNKYLQVYDGKVKEAKQCALIAVDEILKITWVDKFLITEDYWQEVNEEIINI